MSEKLRFTFVISRYGENILGGAEKHARDVAEHLAARGHDVRVLTTCAEQYTTWKNVRPAGEEHLNGVEIVRYPVTVGRLRPLDGVTKALASAVRPSRALGWAWGFAQGPTVPALIEQLEREASARDLVIFFSLLSQLTFEGLRRIGRKSALVPVVHEEPPIYAKLARETLCLPRALLVNTEEEWARIRRVAGSDVSPGAIVAVGLEEPLPRDAGYVPPTKAPYLLILGRAAKTRPMLRVWREVQARRDLPPMVMGNGKTVPWSEVQLVTVGEVSRMYAGMKNVIQLPFVDEHTRWQLVWNATALVNPSIHESLSLVLLEAWACGVPVIVNAKCDVTVGQCRRSGGGFAIDFGKPGEAARQLSQRLSATDARATMARGGEAYARERYRWDRVIGAYEAAAIAVKTSGSLPGALAAWS